MERRYEATCSSPRSRSAPKGGKSPRSPSSFYAFPSTLQDILYGPRQRLTKYADGMRALPFPTEPTAATSESAAVTAAPLPISTEDTEEEKSKVVQAVEETARLSEAARPGQVTTTNVDGRAEAMEATAAVVATPTPTKEEAESEAKKTPQQKESDRVDGGRGDDDDDKDANSVEEEMLIPGVEDGAAPAVTKTKGAVDGSTAESEEQHLKQEVNEAHNAEEKAEAEVKEAEEAAAAEYQAEKAKMEEEGGAAAVNAETAAAISEDKAQQTSDNVLEAVETTGAAVDKTGESTAEANTAAAAGADGAQGNDSSSSAHPHSHDGDEQKEVAEEEKAAEDVTDAAVKGAEEPPQLRATTECVAFDPLHAAAWMSDFRHDTAHVPAGVAAFVRDFDQIAAKFNLKLAGVTSAVASPLVAGAGGKKGKKGSSSFSAINVGSPKGSGSVGGFGQSPMELPSREGGFGGASANPHGGAANNNNNSTNGKKSNALAALGDVWEGRQETPISLAQGSIRRRGLFGEVEKKKLHHMVVAVLNKVTTDPAKFREVKNELLRLPIPEANAEQLTKIVDAFFTKAVREQHFSHSYADLIVALCKVPQGQHIVGDKTQSLEYRLRVALLKRCQSEFVESVKAENNSNNNTSTSGTPAGATQKAAADDASSPLTTAITKAEEAGGETEKERRDRMCGNVRFVCELFLRDVVVGTVISFIFRVCLLGSEFGEFATPPAYTPTESQVDEVITAVRTVKERYFVQNAEGRRMLPQVLGQLDYWVNHYPISRCRFLLMSVVEELRAMLPTPVPEPVPTTVATPNPLMSASSVNLEGTAHTNSLGHQEMALVPSHLPHHSATSYAAAAAGHGATSSSSLTATPAAAGAATTTTSATTALLSSSTHRLPAPREVSESLPGSPPAAAVSSLADASQSPVTSTMVGGQPLPAPRSRQAGNASVSESMNSFAGNATAVVESSAVGSPLLALALTLSSRPLLQGVRPEAIAKFMAALSSGQCTVQEIVTQLFDQYGNVLPVLAAWLDRCLCVAREEKVRKQTGAVLIACAEHLTQHLPPNSPEWAETMGMCQVQVRDAAMEALQRALEGKLYEDLHIFTFWAQLILSDHDRVLFDEELLNEGLELIAHTAPAAMRAYLVDVSKYVNQVLLKPDALPWHPATEAHNFVRFRPLLVLHSLAPSGGPQEAQEMLDDILTINEVRQQSLELRLYHAFRNGTPAHDVLFEQLRSAPRLTSRDPTLAAEVLSAMLIAELCSDGVALVENNMDLIQVTVDGVNRAAREMSLVAEVYEVLRYTPKELPRTAAGRVLRKFVFMHILSDETMDNADRIFEAEREGVMEKSEREGRVLEAFPSQAPPHSQQPQQAGLPSSVASISPGPAAAAAATTSTAPLAAAALLGATTDFPRITDRHAPPEELLSASTSLRSVNGNNNNNNNHNTGESANSNKNNTNGASNNAQHNGGATMTGSAEGAVVDFRAHTAGTNSADGVPSSNASSLAEFRPPRAERQGQGTHNNNNNNNSNSAITRRKRDSEELSSRHSLRQTSPTRSTHDDASKQLYRNSYKNRRRSHENGSELPSSAGGSKDASPQQPPVAHTPSSTYDNSSLENSRLGSSSASRYGRGNHNTHNHNSNNSTHGNHHHPHSSGSNGGGRGRGGHGSERGGERSGRGGGSRGGGRGGDRGTERGGNGNGGRGGGGNNSERGGGGGRGGRGSGNGRSGNSHDDTRRGNDRYNSRGTGGSNRD